MNLEQLTEVAEAVRAAFQTLIETGAEVDRLRSALFDAEDANRDASHALTDARKALERVTCGVERQD